MRKLLIAVIVVAGLAACGREGPLLSTALVSPTPTPIQTAFETPAATASPLPTQSPTATPTASASATPDSTTGGGENAGIFGSVRAGPTCPVEQESSPCPDRPVSDAEVTASDDGGAVAGTARTDAKGEFTLRLPPGSYEVTASSPSVMSCDKQRVDVVERHYTPVRITCDTGIR